MGDHFTYRHHEAHRTKLYIPDATIFSIPMKYVHVMKQTTASIDNASDHTLNDSRKDESKVLLSEKWIGTTRFQTLMIQLLEGDPQKSQIPHDTIRSGSRNGPDYPRITDKRTIEAWDEEKLRFARSLPKNEESSTSHPKIQNT